MQLNPFAKQDTNSSVPEKTLDEKAASIREATVEDFIEDDSTANEFGHGNASFMSAYFNVTCVVAGTGTLGLPKAFATGGWLGILILILAWAMACYSGIILIRCLYAKPGKRLHDYKQIGKAAYGWFGYCAAAFFHFLNLFGCPALYLVLASGNMVDLLEGQSSVLTQSYWVIIWGAFLLIPLILFRTLKEVTIISSIGAICTMMAVFIVMIQGPIDRNSNPQNEVHLDGVIWPGFPSALSTIAFSYGGNNTYPHAEHALKKPHQWKWAVTAGLTTCTALYFMTAVPGYWSYGDAVKSPIYNSLPDGAAKMIAQIVMTIHVIFAIPIYACSFSLEFERFSKCDEQHIGKVFAFLGRAAIRTVTIVILCVLAIFVPYFDAFMSLIGALCNCSLVFLIPILCYLRLTGVRNKPIYELAFCALTLLLGIVGCVFGSWDAIDELIEKFQADAAQ
ncbi:hypothetical protein O0I10_004954 [Lichtheimia ornata]|uniref:Amino acid transporter transmembrane domain-containing protein n=1 Tax=Lichtheimia ornata TaxID=688661 RepID=A0AAD7XYL6_9FUNG|nr:uncharacterized protein O0I10_004954 [Lichtheimia ornata]KAJ8659240.1 hypothetical protein O0I10_004954 [Lichtheimia ornata]